MSTIPTLVTVGVIAAAVHAPLHRVLRVLATRPHIRPAARAGRTRIYYQCAITMVQHELTAMDARRSRSRRQVVG